MRALTGPSVKGHFRSALTLRIATGLVAVLSLLSCKQGGAPGSDISGAVLAPITLPSTPGITLFAGGLGGSGNLDGNGTAARFNAPGGIAVAADGTAYVVDTSDHIIRKITPAGDVSTFAGKAGESGAADGPGTTGARFKSPGGVAIAPDGTIYVTDSGNYTVRRITPAGEVSTFAGLAGEIGRTDGSTDDGMGTDARFNSPIGIAVASDGAVYVSDTLSSTIRKLVPTTMPDGTVLGLVSTFAGVKGEVGSDNGAAGVARFGLPAGMVFDIANNLYVTDIVQHTIRKITPTGEVSTLAGSAGSSGSADGTVSGARFSQPALIAISGNDLYVSDSGNKTVRKVTLAGVVTTLAGVAGEEGAADGVAEARFGVPTGIAVGGDGNLIVGDSGNHTLRRITLPGAVVTTPYGTGVQTGTANANGAAARFNRPEGMVMDGLGNLLVADSLNHTIRKITPDGNVTTYAGTPGTAGATDGAIGAATFNSPKGLAIDASGTVYVADTGNHVIRKITSAGVVSTLAGSAGSFGAANGTNLARFRLPWGIAVDVSGDVYVADTGNHTIRKITSAGVVSTLAGSAGSFGVADGNGVLARFNVPIGIAVDGAGNLYVSDAGNYTIRKITPAGAVNTIAGRAGVSGTADGSALSSDALSGARFTEPSGIAVDANDNVYVNDFGSGTIRKISAGVVSTEVGTVGKRGVAAGPLKGSLSSPRGLFIGPQGELYVTDENAVLLVALDPLIPTFRVRLSAPSPLFLGDEFTLRWNASHAENCVASGNDADWSALGSTVPTSGTMTLVADSLDPDMSYSLQCTEIGGTGNETATVNISVTQPPPTVTLSASADRVDPNGSVTLTWSSTNATSCTASGDWSGAKTTSNSETLTNLTSSKTFTIECSGESGTVSASKSVVVALAPSLSFNVSRQHITLGESVTLNWSSSNTVACTASDNWSGAKPISGTAVIKPGNSVAQLYTLTCTGPGGVVSDSAVVTVDFETATSGNASGSGGGATGLELLLGGGLLALLRRRAMRRSA